MLAVLRSKEKYEDFDLKFRVRFKDGSGNCGVRFRSQAEQPDRWQGGRTSNVSFIERFAIRRMPIGSLAKGSTDKPDVFSARGSAARFTKAADFNQVHIRCEGEERPHSRQSPDDFLQIAPSDCRRGIYRFGTRRLGIKPAKSNSKTSNSRILTNSGGWQSVDADRRLAATPSPKGKHTISSRSTGPEEIGRRF